MNSNLKRLFFFYFKSDPATSSEPTATKKSTTLETYGKLNLSVATDSSITMEISTKLNSKSISSNLTEVFESSFKSSTAPSKLQATGMNNQSIKVQIGLICS